MGIFGAKAIVVHSSEAINPYRDQFGQIEALNAELKEKDRIIAEKIAEIEVLKYTLNFGEEVNLANREFNDMESRVDLCFQTTKEKRVKDEKLFKDFITKLWKMKKKLREIAGNETIFLYDKKEKYFFTFGQGFFCLCHHPILDCIEALLNPLYLLDTFYCRSTLFKKIIVYDTNTEEFIKEVEKNITRFIEEKMKQ